jgi:cytosine permease
MTSPASTGADIESGLGEEYEHEPVPAAARKSLFSVSAVWVGFPMIMTSAVFSGIIVYNLASSPASSRSLLATQC